VKIFRKSTICAAASALFFASLPIEAYAKVQCFRAANGAYCVFPNRGVFRQVCGTPDGSDYCALTEGRGKIVRDFSACSGQAALAKSPAEQLAQDRCSKELTQFENEIAK
jgi:hypothetical protein